MATSDPIIHTYEVILNRAAMGLSAEVPNIVEVQADRVEDSAADSRITFYKGDEIVAQYMHTLGLTRLS